MPNKALVAFGVMIGFGLLGLSAPCWGAAQPAVASAQKRVDITPNPNRPLRESAPALTQLTLEEALRRTQQLSPTLEGYAHEQSARALETRQAGRIPNPEISVEVENFGGSGAFSGSENAETTVRLSQPFELGGKRNHRRTVALQNEQLAARAEEIARAALIAETRTRFVAVLAAQEQLSLAREQLQLTEKLLQTVEDRIAAGEIASIEKIRFQTLVGEAQLRQEQTKQELLAARLTLTTLWGSEQPDFASVAGDLEPAGPLPDWAQLDARMARSPELRYQKEAAAKATQVVALERARQIPDLTLSLGVKDDRDSGDSALVAEIALPLPLFHHNQDAVAAAQARRLKAAAETRSAELRLREQLADHWQQLQTAAAEVVLLQTEILPATQTVFESISYGYGAGKFGYLELVDAERNLFETKQRYLEALVAYHRASAAIERLLGQPLVEQTELETSLSQRQGHTS